MSADAFAEHFASVCVDLCEHLLTKAKRNTLEPLESRLKKQAKKRLKGETNRFEAVFTVVSKRAFRAGAREAMAQLGPIREARRRQKLPALPDPTRVAELAAAEIKWDDLPNDIEAHATMIAETEVSIAYHDGMDAFAGLWRGGNGPVEKRWLVQPDACPTCEENAAMDWIDEEAPFSSGDDNPPAHPNCRCSMEFQQVPE